MSHLGDLLLFAALVFGIVVLPGMDMAFVLGTTLTAGRRHGMAAVAGIVLGGVCHVVMTTLGISVLLQTIPAAFNAVLLAGAVYIAWIGVSLVRAESVFIVQSEDVARSASITFRRGALTCLMNPKAYLFMLAVFPQFLHASYGPLWSQALVLWLIVAIAQTLVYGAIALAGTHARRWLLRRPEAGTRVTHAVGVLLIGVALFTAIEGWRAL